MAVAARSLGQAGVRFELGHHVVYIDPYLSDSLAEMEGPAFARRVPIPYPPESVTDADLVLISHVHPDHCDPGTLPQLAKASPGCRFLGPGQVKCALIRFGIDEARILDPVDAWIPLDDDVRIRPVPAAHTRIERDSDGGFRYLGFVLDCCGRRYYHAGDTSCHTLLIAELQRFAPIHVALLPVNEPNFFRDRLGVVGNMSVREAFQMAEEIGVETLVPIHWDMFAVNSVYPEEIELLYRCIRPRFALKMDFTEL